MKTIQILFQQVKGKRRRFTWLKTLLAKIEREKDQLINSLINHLINKKEKAKVRDFT
jgi:hypothetical protein